MSRTGTVGIVVSGEPPSWNSQSAAFAEGAKAEKADINVRYAVIGPAAYADAAGGKRVTESLIAAGADIIFGQGNGSSFGMLQAVETTKATDGGKVLFIDVIGDKTSIDKGYLLSSVVWDMTPVYVGMIAGPEERHVRHEELPDRPRRRFRAAAEDAADPGQRLGRGDGAARRHHQRQDQGRARLRRRRRARAGYGCPIASGSKRGAGREARLGRLKRTRAGRRQWSRLQPRQSHPMPRS